jgi:MoxR-like ATPase
MVSRGAIVAARQILRTQVAVSIAIHECLVDIAQQLRADKRVRQGVSTRCLVQAIPALQTLAMLRGRDFVSTEDVEYLATPLFAHRLELAPGAKHDQVIGEAVRGPLEALSRRTLK